MINASSIFQYQDRIDALKSIMRDLYRECDDMHEKPEAQWTRQMQEREQYLNGLSEGIREEIKNLELWISQLENDVFGTLGAIFGNR